MKSDWVKSDLCSSTVSNFHSQLKETELKRFLQLFKTDYTEEGVHARARDAHLGDAASSETLTLMW